MSFHSMLFFYNINEMLYKLNSCLYQLVYGKLVHYMSFHLRSKEPVHNVSKDLLYLDHGNWQTIKFRTFFGAGGEPAVKHFPAGVDP